MNIFSAQMLLKHYGRGKRPRGKTSRQVFIYTAVLTAGIAMIYFQFLQVNN